MRKSILIFAVSAMLLACGNKTVNNAGSKETSNEEVGTGTDNFICGDEKKTWINATDGIDKKTWFVELCFNADGTYSGKFDNGKEDTGEWSIDGNELTMKNVFTLKSEIVEKSATQFKIKTASATVLTFRNI